MKLSNAQVMFNKFDHFNVNNGVDTQSLNVEIHAKTRNRMPGHMQFSEKKFFFSKLKILNLNLNLMWSSHTWLSKRGSHKTNKSCT